MIASKIIRLSPLVFSVLAQIEPKPFGFKFGNAYYQNSSNRQPLWVASITLHYCLPATQPDVLNYLTVAVYVRLVI